MSYPVQTPPGSGNNETIPAPGDQGWGQYTSNWMLAANNSLGFPRSGGSYILTGDVNFGTTNGFLLPYVTSSIAGAPATAGVLRLGNTDTIDWRNNANNANLTLGVNTSNQLTYNNNLVLVLGGTGLVSPSQGGTGTSTIPTAGQVLVGTSGGVYAPATIGTGTGIGITSGSGTLTINNTGVTSNIAGAGIGVSGATGAVTISNTGVLSVTGTTNQIDVSSSTGNVTISIDSNYEPTLAATEVGFGSAGNKLTGSTNLTWIDGSSILNVGSNISNQLQVSPNQIKWYSNNPYYQALTFGNGREVCLMTADNNGGGFMSSVNMTSQNIYIGQGPGGFVSTGLEVPTTGLIIGNNLCYARCSHYGQLNITSSYGGSLQLLGGQLINPPSGSYGGNVVAIGGLPPISPTGTNSCGSVFIGGGSSSSGSANGGSVVICSGSGSGGGTNGTTYILTSSNSIIFGQGLLVGYNSGTNGSSSLVSTYASFDTSGRLNLSSSCALGFNGSFGTSGQVPVSTGSSTAPTWTSLTSNWVTNRQTVAPVSSASITITSSINALIYYVVNPNNTLAVLTITMPATPVDGQQVTICFRKAISSLTVSPNTSQSIDAPPAAAVINTSYSWVWDNSLTTWVVS